MRIKLLEIIYASVNQTFFVHTLSYFVHNLSNGTSTSETTKCGCAAEFEHTQWLLPFLVT